MVLHNKLTHLCKESKSIIKIVSNCNIYKDYYTIISVSIIVISTLSLILLIYLYLLTNRTDTLPLCLVPDTVVDPNIVEEIKPGQFQTQSYATQDRLRMSKYGSTSYSSPRHHQSPSHYHSPSHQGNSINNTHNHSRSVNIPQHHNMNYIGEVRMI